MGWFSKNEEVPQIAPAPILPELPKKEGIKKKDLLELPTFPSASKNESFNQEIVKSAVGEIPSSGENKVNVDIPKNIHTTEKPREGLKIPLKPSEMIPELPKHTQIPSKVGAYRTVQDPSWYAEQHEPPQEIPKKPLPEIPKKTFQEIPKKPLELNAVPDYKPIQKRTEPIFVRIDKFQLAQKNLEQIKERVKEMESVLGKIKDTKLREEAELKGWTEDVEKIKSQLSEVDSSVFNQL